tara:strand:- start:179 stop:811 length:633 start_codon:yes stop_codon:yes gene_type:complete
MNKKYLDSKKGSLEEVSTKIAIEQPSIDRTFKSGTKLTTERKYFGTKPGSLSDAAAKVVSEKLDPVNKVAVKKKFDDRKDKDIDNDGDVDKTDKYLHNRRKAISKNIKEKVMPDDKGEKINQMKVQKAKQGEKEIIKPIKEGRMKEIAIDMKELDSEKFKAKYGKSKAEMKKELGTPEKSFADMRKEMMNKTMTGKKVAAVDTEPQSERI